MTLIYTDPLFARHQMPPRHPEQSARMAAVLDALAASRFDGLERRTATPASYEAIARVHPSSYLDRITSCIPETGMIALDPDTHMGPESWDAARLASGAAIAAVDAVVGLEAPNAFVVARPPGHHAERTTAMGFCLINHVAVAARHAQAVHGLGRIAIVDFDVHHGNGTQDIFYDDPSVFYGSTHQSPLYPGTGAAGERGAGNILNVPVDAGTDGAAYRPRFRDTIVAALEDFRPELIILSAGFDAHADDPLGGMGLVEDDYVWITHQMMDVAAQTAHGRLVSVLEGGYDLSALGRSAAAHVGALAGV
ncbi:histone deacetylase family protein [Acuticoccus sp. MNP-M23]|uniref:histone deacetylase family protein n=1 Tax=Acuticoccus sp. MNP-M23 TaxID=3072793 RepID=UPI0028167AC8|nr:histone deacetylase family protein [Acuticoccus sp. MNP-M23]WMS43328.1 histone deacetylase family protein [Acuticoccus sp. MNP-M23]